MFDTHYVDSSNEMKYLKQCDGVYFGV